MKNKIIGFTFCAVFALAMSFYTSNIEASIPPTHCGECDFDSFGGVWSEEGENIGFCNFNTQLYIGCTGNNGSECSSSWACMYNL